MKIDIRVLFTNRLLDMYRDPRSTTLGGVAVVGEVVPGLVQNAPSLTHDVCLVFDMPFYPDIDGVFIFSVTPRHPDLVVAIQTDVDALYSPNRPSDLYLSKSDAYEEYDCFEVTSTLSYYILNRFICKGGELGFGVAGGLDRILVNFETAKFLRRGSCQDFLTIRYAQFCPNTFLQSH